MTGIILENNVLKYRITGMLMGSNGTIDSVLIRNSLYANIESLENIFVDFNEEFRETHRYH